MPLWYDVYAGQQSDHDSTAFANPADHFLHASQRSPARKWHFQPGSQVPKEKVS
jgi:hypothetical protein